MARKVGQIIARGDRRWLIRVYLGREHETNRRKYHNRTIHGPLREAQAYLTRKLRERDIGRDLEGSKTMLTVCRAQSMSCHFRPKYSLGQGIRSTLDLVFRTPLGQPINADCLAKHFRSILDLAGVPRIRLYDLRPLPSDIVTNGYDEGLGTRYDYDAILDRCIRVPRLD